MRETMTNAKKLRELAKQAKLEATRIEEGWWRLELPRVLLRLERDARGGENVTRIFYETKCPKSVLKELKTLGFRAQVQDAQLSEGYFLKVQW